MRPRVKEWRKIGIICPLILPSVGIIQHNPKYVRCTSENLESRNVIIVSGFTWMIRAVIDVVKTGQTVTT